MGELSLRSPEPLIVDITSTSMATTWELWLESIEMYFKDAGIDNAKRQKALLLYLGGRDLQQIHRTLNDDKETFTDTKNLLNAYFKPQANLTFERNKFYTCCQKENETVAAFVTRLKDAARTCDFAHYTSDAAIMDQAVSKCCSQKLRRRMLREQNLTLDKLLTIAYATESSEQQAIHMEKK